MIDLHMHTKYSDGADEVCDLLKKAEGLNLKVIAVTDHNTCLEYGELNNPPLEIREKFLYSFEDYSHFSNKCDSLGIHKIIPLSWQM